MLPNSNPSDAVPQPAPARSRSDRRKRSIPVATDRRHAEASPAPDRRQRDIPAAVDSRKHEPAPEPPAPPVVDHEEAAFKTAMDRYKRENRRPFPTWSEVLEVLRSLGYRKVAEESEFPGQKKDPGTPPAKG